MKFSTFDVEKAGNIYKETSGHKVYSNNTLFYVWLVHCTVYFTTVID